MPYVVLSDREIYYEVTGSGPALIALHGGFCSIETLRPQIEALEGRFQVYAPERPGQGRTADREGPITFDLIVSDTLDFMEAVGLASAHVLGFSDGGIAGILLARDHPDRVLSLVAIGANLDPNGLSDEPVEDKHVTHDARFDGDASAESIDSQLRRDYDRLSPDGPDHADVVLAKLARLWTTEPHIAVASLATVTAPTLVLAGQYDSIRLDHTASIAAAIPNAELCILPGAGHMVMIERPALVNLVVSEFLESVTTSSTRA